MKKDKKTLVSIANDEINIICTNEIKEQSRFPKGGLPIARRRFTLCLSDTATVLGPSHLVKLPRPFEIIYIHRVPPT